MTKTNHLQLRFSFVRYLQTKLNWEFFTRLTINQIILAYSIKTEDASDVISDVLTKIFNKSIDLGTFSSKLKMAKVTPSFKSDDNTDPKNYRPISLFSCFNRSFEKLVYKTMKSFIEEKTSYVRHNKALDKGIQRNTRYLTLSVEFNQIWMQGPFLVVFLLT